MGVTVRFVKGSGNRKGRWVMFFHEGDRKKSKTLGGDRAAALRAKKDMEERLSRVDLGLHILDKETFQQYAERWLEGASLKASTKRFYADHLKNHVYPLVGKLPVSAVTRAHVKELLERMHAKKLRPKTITGIHRTLSTVLSEAVEDGKMVANPALRPGRLRRAMVDPDAPKAAEIDPYTREEAALLVTTATAKYPEWADFLLTALRTGMRLGELRALEWDDIDWRGRYILVSRNFVEGAATTPKSGRARRVDMSDQLRTALRLRRRQQGAYWLKEGKERPRLVFPSSTGTPLDDSKARKAMRAIAVAADVRPRARMVHVLRHTFCSLLVAAGEPVTYVMEQAGHSSITVTAGYLKYMPGGQGRGVNKLDAPEAHFGARAHAVSHAKGKRNAQ
jgi:integrase